MSEFRKIILRPEALQYVRESLADGNTLSAVLLETIELEKGIVMTHLPSEVSEAAAHEFTTGGKLPPTGEAATIRTSDGTSLTIAPTPSTTLQLARSIHLFLAAGLGQVCVFENSLAKVSDVGIQAQRNHILSFGEEVYHAPERTQSPVDEIERIIRDVRSWVPIGVLAAVGERATRYSPPRSLSIEDLKLLAVQAERIVVGAYDGEGYLVWSKPE